MDHRKPSKITEMYLESHTNCETSLKFYSGLSPQSPAVTSDICGKMAKTKIHFIPSDKVTIRFKTGINSRADFRLTVTSCKN